MRTTIDIADPILKEVKRLQQRENKPLGRLVSELLAQALASQRQGGGKPPKFEWTAKAMGARIDLDDKGALLDAMDRSAK
jgi:mRNA-degrading endonuclease RelE of RelBE toxin-antitoxin system